MSAKLPNTPKAWVDPDDASELGAEFFENAVPMVGDKPVSRAQYAKAVRRGRPAGTTKEDAKVATTIRFDADVLAALKATGPGWQTRINAALRALFAPHSA